MNSWRQSAPLSLLRFVLGLIVTLVLGVQPWRVPATNTRTTWIRAQDPSGGTRQVPSSSLTRHIGGCPGHNYHDENVQLRWWRGGGWFITCYLVLRHEIFHVTRKKARWFLKFGARNEKKIRISAQWGIMPCIVLHPVLDVGGSLISIIFNHKDQAWK